MRPSPSQCTAANVKIGSKFSCTASLYGEFAVDLDASSSNRVSSLAVVSPGLLSLSGQDDLSQQMNIPSAVTECPVVDMPYVPTGINRLRRMTDGTENSHAFA